LQYFPNEIKKVSLGLNPTTPIPAVTTAVHGITDDKVEPTLMNLRRKYYT
jgi:DNA polymerase III epsilon subunit-like protein